MTFNELVEEVLSITKRPDLMDSIKSAVRYATLKAHRQNYFYRDLQESGVSFDEPDYIQNFLPTQIYGSRFRKLKYIRFWYYDSADPTNYGKAGDFLTPIDIENAIDNYGYIKTNVFYMAGNLIQIRTSTPLSHCLTGAYLLPVVSPEGDYSSWIADLNPYAIIYEACRRIFGQIGKRESATDMTSFVNEEYAQLLLDSLNAPGE